MNYKDKVAHKKLKDALYNQLAEKVVALYRSCYKFDSEATELLDEILPILDKHKVLIYEGKDPDTNVVDFESYRKLKEILKSID